MNKHEKLVKTVHPEAVLTGIRGLKLYIIECDNHMGWRKGLGYGEQHQPKHGNQHI